MSDPQTPTSSLPPVTVLCGFLGAGKTTLLNHLLTQSEGRRWAAIVNDVAAVNIDAALVRVKQDGVAIKDVVELGNGCVCCSNRDELAEAIAELATDGAYDHIIVETSGVALPQGVAALFTRKNPFGRSLADFSRLSALVSVVDSPHFLKEWRAYSENRVVRTAPGPGERPVFELMVEQVECSDVLVLNKCDLLEEKELIRLEEIVAGLNDRAACVRAERGQVASEFLLGRVRFDARATLGSARWVKVLNASAAAQAQGFEGSAGSGKSASRSGQLSMNPAARKTARHEEEFGIHSFVYEARRPFVQEKLRAFVEGGAEGLLRAKGFFWVSERPDEMGFLSVAGGVARLDFMNYWWAALVENGRVSREEVPPLLEKLWREPMGDRRQELVFIGVCLDEAAVRRVLDGCLA